MKSNKLKTEGVNRKSVMVATMQTFDSLRTSPRAASREESEAQSMIWDDFMTSREAIFRPVMFRRTLLSPITEKSHDILRRDENNC